MRRARGGPRRPGLRAAERTGGGLLGARPGGLCQAASSHPCSEPEERLHWAPAQAEPAGGSSGRAAGAELSALQRRRLPLSAPESGRSLRERRSLAPARRPGTPCASSYEPRVSWPATLHSFPTSCRVMLGWRRPDEGRAHSRAVRKHKHVQASGLCFSPSPATHSCV